MAEIGLRAIEKEDLEIIQAWRNSELVMPNCRQYRKLSMVDMVRWYDSLSRDGDYNLTNDMFMLHDRCGCIGVAGIVRIDWRNRKGEVSFYIGEPAECNEETIVNGLNATLHFGLATLGLRKLYFPCYSYNQFLPIYEKVMDREYVAREEYYWEGKFYDRIVLVKYASI